MEGAQGLGLGLAGGLDFFSDGALAEALNQWTCLGQTGASFGFGWCLAFFRRSPGWTTPILIEWTCLDQVGKVWARSGSMRARIWIYEALGEEALGGRAHLNHLKRQKPGRSPPLRGLGYLIRKGDVMGYSPHSPQLPAGTASPHSPCWTAPGSLSAGFFLKLENVHFVPRELRNLVGLTAWS